MKLHMLGTGNALVTECYNTCFVLEEEQSYFLVDGGGGNGVLSQLKKANIDWQSIRDIFVTHKHLDHITGILWMIRLIAQNMCQGKYEGEVNIYGHEEVIRLLYDISSMLLQPKQVECLHNRIHLITVEDQDTYRILNHDVTFFDIGSTKAKQFGFSMKYEDEKILTCCGDEPYNECEKAYVENCTWLLHEAFCLYGQADVFKPYEKHHSTVKDACELAQNLGVKNLLLYHSEDKNIKDRKALYTQEGKAYYDGCIVVPDDLEVIDL